MIENIKVAKHQCHKHHKALLGIETSEDTTDYSSKKFCHKHHKALLGIETFTFSLVSSFIVCHKHHKALLGIETYYEGYEPDPDVESQTSQSPIRD